MLQPVGQLRGLRLVGTLVCCTVSACSLLANFLPDTRYFRRGTWMCSLYGFFVHYVAFFALNWRTRLPSLDIEFMGFSRRIGHAFHNWQQDRVDRREVLEDYDRRRRASSVAAKSDSA